MTKSEPVRIQKFLSQEGILSRRQAEEAIAKGHVFVNGVVAEIGQKVDPSLDKVTLHPILEKKRQRFTSILFHKPIGIVTHSKQFGETEIRDLLPKHLQHLAPVGRLDKDSEGLILLTDDGVFAKSLLHGPEPHARVYEVWVDQDISDEFLKKLSKGVYILNGYLTQPCKVFRLGPRFFSIHLKEGKNRQIRRMVATLGLRVSRLKRISFGPYKLGRLPKGKFLVV